MSLSLAPWAIGFAEAVPEPRHDSVVSRGQKRDRLSPMLRDEFQRRLD